MEKGRSGCPINQSLEIIGDKWSLLIIRDIMFAGKRHFRELLQSEEKIASNILTNRLDKLEQEGLLSKNSDPGHKQKYIYQLTEAGIDLLPVLAEIGTWSIKHRPVDLQKYKHAGQVAKGGKEMLKEIRKGLVKVHLK